MSTEYIFAKIKGLKAEHGDIVDVTLNRVLAFSHSAAAKGKNYKISIVESFVIITPADQVSVPFDVVLLLNASNGDVVVDVFGLFSDEPTAFADFIMEAQAQIPKVKFH